MTINTQRLRVHVEILARRPRPYGTPELEQARAYAVEHLTASGWQVERRPFEAVTEDGVPLSGVNLVARHQQFRRDDLPLFCLGAHIDSRPETPGADDNASAVAALLEIARLLPEDWPDAPAADIELVVFDLEENGMLGGAAHARTARESAINLCGMVSLEMLGYCDPTPGSQQLPPALVGQYPTTGDFIAVVGNQVSGELIARFRQGFEQVEGLPVESLQVPHNGRVLEATRLSDHSPFWDAGYAALMITDTSFLRNPHYHLPSDTPDTLDYDFLTRVASGALGAVRLIQRAGV